MLPTLVAARLARARVAVAAAQTELLRVPLSPGSARRRAFERWLALLSEAMPGARNRAALARLRELAAPVRDARHWAMVLRGGPRPLLPQAGGATGSPSGGGVISWRACRGWSAESRGYPCGLWSLFHALVLHAPDAPAALLAIRGFVEHFFGVCTRGMRMWACGGCGVGRGVGCGWGVAAS